MKGKLIYDQEGWWVQHKAKGLDGNLEYIAESMLHPDDVKQIEEDAKMFDNIEARIAAYPDVEFEMVTEVVASVGNSEEQDEYTNTYARLIPSKEQQKQLITEIMDLDAKDGLYDTVNDTVNEVDADFPIEHKLASVWVFDTNASKWSNNDDTAGDNYASFIAGYRKAKETLYTEEQVWQAAFDAYVKANNESYELTPSDIIQSLKQPKNN
jgi:hypothetical protein